MTAPMHRLEGRRRRARAILSRSPKKRCTTVPFLPYLLLLFILSQSSSVQKRKKKEESKRGEKEGSTAFTPSSSFSFLSLSSPKVIYSSTKLPLPSLSRYPPSFFSLSPPFFASLLQLTRGPSSCFSPSCFLLLSQRLLLPSSFAAPLAQPRSREWREGGKKDVLFFPFLHGSQARFNSSTRLARRQAGEIGVSGPNTLTARWKRDFFPSPVSFSLGFAPLLRRKDEENANGSKPG